LLLLPTTSQAHLRAKGSYVHASPSFDTGIKKVDRLARGGGDHGSGGGTHSSSKAGGHTTGSEEDASSGEGKEENNSSSYHNNNSHGVFHSNNSNGELVTSNSSSNQDNPSTLQILWSFFLMCIGFAIIIYFIRRLPNKDYKKRQVDQSL